MPDHFPDAGHDFFLMKPVAIDVAIRVNHWLLSNLPEEGLPSESANRVENCSEV
jgi:hypothetical protein